MQLIDKAAVIAEIERKKDEEVDYDESSGNFASYADQIHYSALDSIENFINTLEVKEVNLDNTMTDINFEEEIDIFMYGTRNPERFPDTFQVRDEHTGLNVLDWKCYVNNPKYRIEFAKYFFELGLKVQKGK